MGWNLFRYLGDFSHLASFLVLIYTILKRESAAGLSLKTQELYALVFICRYLDLIYMFSKHAILYNTIFKIFYITVSCYIVYLIRFNKAIKATYDRNTREKDGFVSLYVIVPCIILALLKHYSNSFMELSWAFSIYLEAVAIFPQLLVLHRLQKIENLTTYYMFFLGLYKVFYVLNWIWRILHDPNYTDWIVWIAGIVQVLLYVDFFINFYQAKKEGMDKDVILDGKL